ASCSKADSRAARNSLALSLRLDSLEKSQRKGFRSVRSRRVATFSGSPASQARSAESVRCAEGVAWCSKLRGRCVRLANDSTVRIEDAVMPSELKTASSAEAAVAEAARSSPEPEPEPWLTPKLAIHTP